MKTRPMALAALTGFFVIGALSSCTAHIDTPATTTGSATTTTTTQANSPYTGATTTQRRTTTTTY